MRQSKSDLGTIHLETNDETWMVTLDGETLHKEELQKWIKNESTTIFRIAFAVVIAEVDTEKIKILRKTEQQSEQLSDPGRCVIFDDESYAWICRVDFEKGEFFLFGNHDTISETQHQEFIQSLFSSDSKFGNWKSKTYQPRNLFEAQNELLRALALLIEPNTWDEIYNCSFINQKHLHTMSVLTGLLHTSYLAKKYAYFHRLGSEFVLPSIENIDI